MLGTDPRGGAPHYVAFTNESQIAIEGVATEGILSSCSIFRECRDSRCTTMFSIDSDFACTSMIVWCWSEGVAGAFVFWTDPISRPSVNITAAEHAIVLCV